LSRTVITAILTLFFHITGRSQTIQLRILSEKKSPVSDITYKKACSGQEEAYREINKVITELQYQGYLLAGADSIWSDSTTLSAKIKEGEQFRTAILKLGNLNPVIASRAGINEKIMSQKPFRYRELAKGFEKILRYFENNGYPFATVSLDSVQIDGTAISAVLKVEKNKLYRIDSIKIEGNPKVSKSFLHQYLQVKEGMPYNEEVLMRISKNIKQLPFVQEKQTQVVRLTNKTNRLILFLDRKNASQFDGIVGILPNSNTGKTIITGDVKLKLVNGIFRNGETFDLQWRRLQNQTQDFAGRVIYPYIAGTPIGLDYYLKIYRKDSSFIDINNQMAVHYYFKGLNYLKLGYKQRNSNLISTSKLNYTNGLPEYADVVTKSYGLGFYYENLNYRFNPHQGISMSTNGQTGNRQINKNPNISDQVYEGLVLKTLQYQVDAQIAVYLRLYRNHVLKLSAQGASVFGNSTLFRNELFRIGGLRTLRGFDEESIYASTYVIPTVEYRFLFAQNSNLLVFGEGAWYENVSNGSYVKDTPLSFGAGFNFETKAGILTVTYALGKQFSNDFDFRNGKIHFGLIALF
jgi:outer membrane protein assembly factor BamA